MNKSELIAFIAERTNEKKATIDRVLTSLGQAASVALTDTGEIVLPEIGKLKLVERKARTGRNPSTGLLVDIPAKNGVKFVAAKVLKDSVQ